MRVQVQAKQRLVVHPLSAGGACSCIVRGQPAVAPLVWLVPPTIADQAPLRRSTFRLPTDQLRPVVMVGPGTGLAPFRGFLQQLSALRAQGASSYSELEFSLLLPHSERL